MKNVHRKFISLMGVRLCDRCGQGPIAGKAAMEAHNAVACPNPRKKGEEEEEGETEKDKSKGEKVRYFERDYSITSVHYLRVQYSKLLFQEKEKTKSVSGGAGGAGLSMPVVAGPSNRKASGPSASKPGPKSKKAVPGTGKRKRAAANDPGDKSSDEEEEEEEDDEEEIPLVDLGDLSDGDDDDDDDL